MAVDIRDMKRNSVGGPSNLKGIKQEESLSDKVIAYEQIQKWDGVMPKVTGSESGMLIDIDLDSLGGSSKTAQQPQTENNAQISGLPVRSFLRRAPCYQNQVSQDPFR